MNEQLLNTKTFRSSPNLILINVNNDLFVTFIYIETTVFW
jgi:hypothetical protein